MPKEESLKESVKNYFSIEKAGIEPKQIIIIHSDRELEYKESLKIGYEPEEKSEKKESVAFDYLELFKRLIYSDLLPNEIEQLNKISEKAKIYVKSKITKDHEEKVKLLTRAIELIPGSAKFYFDRGETLQHLKKFEEAKENYLNSITLESSNSDAFYYLGYCYSQLGDNDKAIKAYEEAIKLNPKNSAIYRSLGYVYHKLSNFQASIEYYLKALEIDPLSHNAANGLADNYRKLGNFNLAVKYVNQSLEINPKYAAAFSTLAEIKAYLNQTEDFYLFLTIGLKLDKQIAEFFYEDSVYERLHEERFQKLCERLGINLKELEEMHIKGKPPPSSAWGVLFGVVPARRSVQVSRRSFRHGGHVQLRRTYIKFVTFIQH